MIWNSWKSQIYTSEEKEGVNLAVNDWATLKKINVIPPDIHDNLCLMSPQQNSPSMTVCEHGRISWGIALIIMCGADICIDESIFVIIPRDEIALFIRQVHYKHVQYYLLSMKVRILVLPDAIIGNNYVGNIEGNVISLCRTELKYLILLYPNNCIIYTWTSES